MSLLTRPKTHTSWFNVETYSHEMIYMGILRIKKIETSMGGWRLSMLLKHLENPLMFFNIYVFINKAENSH